MDSSELLEFFFVSRTGIDPGLDGVVADPYVTDMSDLPDGYRPDTSFVRGKVVLDAGCGPGRFTRVAANAGAAFVVGLDVAGHLARTARRCADLPNVALVQGSVLAPPFKEGAFDFAFSIGVLHHTDDPERGVAELSRVVTPSGSLSIWVYPPDYWGGRLRGPVNRFIHGRLRRWEPQRAWRFCSRYLFALGRIQLRLAARRWTKILCAPLFLVSVPRHPSPEVMRVTIFDYFAAPVISTHTFEEVESWLRVAGLSDVSRSSVPAGCLARGSSL
ncbi:MAG TPA: class I SAM-dependent methyltransferase [Actinomycetota bacterium]|nr:class I SAM-dependent methyltransferase [Actinomycetota bacterium]